MASHERGGFLYKVKQTNTIDGSKVLPYDQMNAEMFYPLRQENVDTTAIVEDMAANEVAPAVLGELCDPKKLFQNTLQLLVASSAGVKLPMRSIRCVLVKLQPMILLKVHLHS